MNELNVIAVPAVNWDGSIHTAFTVYSNSDGVLRASSGWTLKDALQFYAQDYGLEKSTIRVRRPFKRQR